MSRHFRLGHRNCGRYIWCFKREYVHASVLLTPGGSRCPMEWENHVNNWFCSMSKYVIHLSLSFFLSRSLNSLLFLHLSIHSLRTATAQAGFFFSDYFHSFLRNLDCLSVIVLYFIWPSVQGRLSFTCTVEIISPPEYIYSLISV